MPWEMLANNIFWVSLMSLMNSGTKSERFMVP
jgi:hypothetical protein